MTKKYTKDHEWIECNNDIGTVGITNSAQEQLGDVVFFELPEINKNVKKGEQVGVVESVKAASELYTPVSGSIVEINNELKNNPSLVNSDPENSAWYMKIKLDDLNELNELMNLEQYKDMIK
ncbi:MAG: glycine cleavage system protein H [Pelagibacteraceae bacterium]|nr:glycine cleavage system protein H [Pelagibacteraceae bacterium]PPR51126.1 MAG: Glycine cleavage system H protein [Alphaproteobacteria bacterium MarineAlpha5_Bin10]|tara:strand:+ start:15730 stop:16095 length:366 start_codon:yes stop_codon:yes gene_type:complete